MKSQEYKSYTSSDRDALSRTQRLGSEPILGEVIHHSFSTLKQQVPAVTPGFCLDFLVSCKGSENSDGVISLTAKSKLPKYTRSLTRTKITRKEDSYCSCQRAMIKTIDIAKIEISEELNWFSSLNMSDKRKAKCLA